MTIKRKNFSPGWIGFLVGIGLLYFSAWSMSRADDTAGLLPPAVQQFFDSNGNPLSSGKVYFYEVGTTIFKDVYNSSAATTPYTNPITLNAGGKPPGGSGIYGIGLYRQIVKDRNGNTIWDAVTSPTGSGGTTPTLVGDGNLVGTVLPWSGLIAPNQYVFAYGQEISRVTYSDFLTAITLQTNVICSASSNTLTGITDTTQIPVGAAIELSLCVIPGTTVVSKTASTVTLSNPSTVSINAVATFFPFGNGNGTTTFNVPDLRGQVIAGRNNMGGSASSRLTSTYFLSSPDALGAVGGSQSLTISTSNLPSFVVNIHDPGHQHQMHTAGQASLSGSSSQVMITANPAAGQLVGPTDTATTGITADYVGLNVAVSKVQPTLTLNYIIKVTPDTSTSIATGVYSIGGMSGVISCGTGILCTGNIISANTPITPASGTIGSLIYWNSSTTISNSTYLFIISPDTLTLGVPGITGKFDLYGSTSGRVRQTASAVAGTTDITWGNTSGTPAAVAASPLFINSTTGTIRISPDGMTRVNDTNVTLSLSSGASTSTISPVTLTLGWTGQLAVGRGGTGLGSGTSGGVPYFNSTSTMTSSGLLGANQIMVGGGAGAAPSTFACATTTTVVHGGTPPTCSQIVSGDITTNTITNSNLAQIAASTIKGNPTSSTANVTEFTLGSLTQTVSPGSLDWMLIYDNSTNTFKKINATSIATASVAGVSSIAGNAGAFTLSTGITNSVNDIRADIASAANFEAGTASKLLDANVVFTSETTTTYGATTAFDFNTFINTKVTLTGNTTLTCSNIKAGQAGTIALIQDGTGSRVITPNSISGWCSQFKFAGATVPTLSTSASAVDILSYSCRSSSYCAAGLSKGYNP